MRYAAITDRLAHLGGAKWEVHLRGKAMAAAGVPILSLSIGEPDVPPPQDLLQRAPRQRTCGNVAWKERNPESIRGHLAEQDVVGASRARCQYDAMFFGFLK